VCSKQYNPFKENIKMSYKITRSNEAARYEAPGHFDVRTTRLHNPADVNDGRIVIGFSHFLPGGGASKNASPSELIYYTIKGEISITLDDGTFVLKAGDSIHLGPMTTKEIKNTGFVTAEMLVLALPSDQPAK
jgi:mannose-6-phosphate isomerase-like protein (cupin superfamily)